MERPVRVVSESDASLESFHDCHVHGFRWRRGKFAFTMNLEYIVEWIAPTDDVPGYRFLVSEGELEFRSVGSVQRYFQIEFADPEAIISRWSTGYEVTLLQEPVISAVPSRQ